jgi:hypothetical protein
MKPNAGFLADAKFLALKLNNCQPKYSLPPLRI